MFYLLQIRNTVTRW